MGNSKIEWTECACGCGTTINAFDPQGRKRKYLPGHNSKTPEMKKLLSTLKKGISSGLSLDKNPNWGGGRVIASNGYVLIKMSSHPFADSRGYVYEHRLVAEKKIGRYLLPGEIVHHKDGDKQHNTEDNIVITENIAQHRAKHRKNNSNRRIPGEPNLRINCACGCGENLMKFDKYGRPRCYINGHNAGVKSHEQNKDRVCG